MPRRAALLLLVAPSVASGTSSTRLLRSSRAQDPRSDLLADIRAKEAVIAQLEQSPPSPLLAVPSQTTTRVPTTVPTTVAIESVTEPAADGSRQIPGNFPDQGLGGIPVPSNVVGASVDNAPPSGLDRSNTYIRDNRSKDTVGINRLGNTLTSEDATSTPAMTASPPYSDPPPPLLLSPRDDRHHSATYAAGSTIPPLEPLAMGQPESGSTFDPNALSGNPIVESSSTAAVWDDDEGGSVLVSKYSGKPVLDEPVITGTYEVDHLDDKTLDDLPTPVGHVPAKKLHMLNKTSLLPNVMAASTCSRECCSTLLGSSTSVPIVTSVESEEAVALASDSEQRRLFDKYVVDANVGGVAELVDRWESASKRLMELVERAKRMQAKSMLAKNMHVKSTGPEAPPLTDGMSMSTGVEEHPPATTILMTSTGAEGATGVEDSERPHGSIVLHREKFSDDNQNISVLPPRNAPARISTKTTKSRPGAHADASLVLIETTETPVVPDVRLGTDDAPESNFLSAIFKAHSGESRSSDDRARRKAEVDKQIADIMQTTRERVKIIEKEGQDEISAVKTAD